MVSFALATAVILLVGVHAGSYTSPDGYKVSWTVTGSLMTATVVMPASLSANYGWWGVGFKPSGSAQDMGGALLWTITKDGVFWDSYTTDKTTPNIMNSKMTATMVSHVGVAGVYTTVITRNLAASGTNDLSFTVGSTYLMLYSHGQMDGTMPLRHTKTGGATITLSEDYEVNDSDTGATPVVLVGAASLGLLCLAIH